VFSPAAAGPARVGKGDGSSAGGARDAFAALSVRNFRRYVSGQALSLIGTWVETVAQALLVLSLTHSGVVLGSPPPPGSRRSWCCRRTRAYWWTGFPNDASC
jgi:hypothetical protein